MCLTIQCQNFKTQTHPVERKNVSCTACTCSFKCQTDIEATQFTHLMHIKTVIVKNNKYKNKHNFIYTQSF